MSKDVLKKWATTIREAEWISKRQPFVGSDRLCIADLAAALRAERTARLEEDAAHMKALTRIANDDDEIMALTARVAELEPDAKLGRMVREMPVEQRLIHTVYGDWWYGRNVRGEFGATGASPEAVLEAARKGGDHEKDA